MILTSTLCVLVQQVHFLLYRTFHRLKSRRGQCSPMELRCEKTVTQGRKALLRGPMYLLAEGNVPTREHRECCSLQALACFVVLAISGETENTHSYCNGGEGVQRSQRHAVLLCK